jgi:surface polysaccharide O-acyltransferase-like enzyme
MLRRFLLLNGLATLGVVLNHSAAWGFVAMFWWPHRYLGVATPNFDQLGSLPYYALRTIEQLIIFSIPGFLFVSGFFIAFATGRSQATINRTVLGVRLWYLVIPYLLWSLLILYGDFLQGARYGAGDFLGRLVMGQATSAYYFVPLLCQLYLLSPLLVRMAKTRWRMLLAVTGLIQIAVQLLLYLDTLGINTVAAQPVMFITASWLFPGHLFWFAAGIVVGFRPKALERELPRFRWAFLACAVALIPLGVLEWEAVLRFSGQQWLPPRVTILDSFYAGAVILCFLSFTNLPIPFAREVSQLGGKSFGVYLIHSPVLELTARVIYHVVPWILGYQILFQPILIFAGLSIPLTLMAVANFRRSPARGYYQYIFG